MTSIYDFIEFSYLSEGSCRSTVLVGVADVSVEQTQGSDEVKTPLPLAPDEGGACEDGR